LGSRIVQVPMDEALIDALDVLAASLEKSRASIVRTACEAYLERMRNAAEEARYVEGYRQIPENDAVGEAQVGALGQVLDKGRW